MSKQALSTATVVATVDALTNRLASARPVRREALRYFLVILVSLELYVEDAKRPEYFRFLVGLKLMKVWSCLRHDDICGFGPQAVRDLGDRYAFTLARTKTTGPDKRRWPIDAHLHKCCWVAKDWQVTFIKMITNEPFG